MRLKLAVPIDELAAERLPREDVLVRTWNRARSTGPHVCVALIVLLLLTPADALGQGEASAVGSTLTIGSEISVTVPTDDLDADGDCSLREAIIAANTDAAIDACAAGSGRDTIVLPALWMGLSIPGILEDASETGDLDIRDDLTIIGAGRFSTVIDGHRIDRVLDLHGEISVTLRDLRIQGGDVKDPEFAMEMVQGHGGSIRNAVGALTVIRAHVIGDAFPGEACWDCADGYGGGIFNEAGELTVIGSVIEGESGHGGGAIANGSGTVSVSGSILRGRGHYGGGLFNAFGQVEVRDTLFERTETHAGAAAFSGSRLTSSLIIRDSVIREGIGTAIFATGGSLIVVDTTIAVNDTSGRAASDHYGAGVTVWQGATAQLVRVSITDNINTGGAGGVLNEGRLTIRDSLIARNRAGVGGILSRGHDSSISIVNTTVTDNVGAVASVDLEGGLVRSSTIIDNSVEGWGYGARFARTQISNSVLAHSVPDDDTSSECFGDLLSGGFNLIEQVGDCSVGGATTDLFGIDPQLSDLRDNGGTTLSHVPLPESPLIDAGNPGAPGDGAPRCPTVDQIGMPRPQDGDGDGKARCDIGATERRTNAGLVPIDVKPGVCPNHVNVTRSGSVVVAVPGRVQLRAARIRPSSIRLEGIRPSSWALADVATPLPPEGAQPNACTDAGADGRVDLVLRFDIQAIRRAIEPVPDGDVRALRLTGKLKDAYGATPLRGSDAIVVRK
jgi:CSLREA domain-containing protein